MLIKKRRAWQLPESAATPEDIYMNRRQWLKAVSFAGLGLASTSALSSVAMAAIGGYP
ncbi:MAG: mononuclear molybdenum enzyme YedY, partial [Rhodospirillaceae bacterium]|nr:mononuclear molybdenum enzyme YedY [Rhodospirillaceae bacterium]